MEMLTEKVKLPFWSLIPSAFLLIIYIFLSNLAINDPTFWYESMEIPQPEHGFLLISWAGKNTAMVMSLLLAVLTRQRLPVLIAMAVLFTGQIGDSVAGSQTGVNVFVTYIGMAFVALQLILLYVIHTR